MLRVEDTEVPVVAERIKNEKARRNRRIREYRAVVNRYYPGSDGTIIFSDSGEMQRYVTAREALKKLGVEERPEISSEVQRNTRSAKFIGELFGTLIR